MDLKEINRLRSKIKTQPYDIEARLELGKLLAFSKAPEGAESFVYATRLLMQEDRWVEAISVLRQLLTSYPDHAEAILLMRRIFARKRTAVLPPSPPVDPANNQAVIATEPTSCKYDPSSASLPLTMRKAELGEVLGPADLFISIDDLPTHSILEGLSDQVLTHLLQMCLLVEYAPFTLLLDYAEKTNALRLILDGVVSIERQHNGSHREIERFGAGEIFGEVELLSGIKTEQRVIARTHCRLLELRADIVQCLAESSPSVWTNIWEHYKERMLNNVLRTMPVFAPLDPNIRRAFASCFWEEIYEIESVLVEENSINNSFLLLLGGEVIVTKIIDGVSRAIQTLGPGAIIGFVSVCLEKTALTTITALSSCRVMSIARDQIIEFMRQQPALAKRSRLEAIKRKNIMLHFIKSNY